MEKYAGSFDITYHNDVIVISLENRNLCIKSLTIALPYELTYTI